jgi:hypothetical protein
MKNKLKQQLVSVFARMALTVAMAAGVGAASAGTIHVTVDTSHFTDSAGYLDMNLSASANVPLATALVSNLAGFDSNPFIDSWGVTPVAGGGYLFRNDTSNDLFQSVHFGGLLFFDLTFAGAFDPVTSYVSHFAVSAFGSDAMTPLGNYDPVTGTLVDFSWTPAQTALGSGTVGGVASDSGVHVVPEPADVMLMGIGMAALTLVVRRRVR